MRVVIEDRSYLITAVPGIASVHIQGKFAIKLPDNNYILRTAACFDYTQESVIAMEDKEPYAFNNVYAVFGEITQ